MSKAIFRQSSQKHDRNQNQKKSRQNRDFKFHIQAYFTSTGTEI